MTQNLPELAASAEPFPNLPLLRKVLDHIDAHPEEWDQTQYAQRTDCGTAFCIAGWAVALATGWEPAWHQDMSYTAGFIRPDGTRVETARAAREFLGLTDQEADICQGLFSVYNTRADVQRYAERIAARAGEAL